MTIMTDTHKRQIIIMTTVLKRLVVMELVLTCENNTNFITLYN